MNKKDYILIAEAFQYSRPSKHRTARYIQWLHDVRIMSRALEDANERFNPETFLTVCKHDHLNEEK